MTLDVLKGRVQIGQANQQIDGANSYRGPRMTGKRHETREHLIVREALPVAVPTNTVYAGGKGVCGDMFVVVVSPLRAWGPDSFRMDPKPSEVLPSRLGRILRYQGR